MSTSPRAWQDNPANISADYKSSATRGPTKAPISLSEAQRSSLSQITGPSFSGADVTGDDADLTQNARVNGEPLGERIIVSGRLVDEGGRAIPNAVIEVWQANACGRYVDRADQHDAPLDPNFLGAGRCATDAAGHYRFCTIKPGAYPWGNHHNAWRPAHIHISVFGPSIATRLITQFYFPGDPLLALDPIFMATPEHARQRLIANFDLDTTQPDYALGYQFDIVLRGNGSTPWENSA